jgi:predicted amidophosphoribosyltransferase
VSKTGLLDVIFPSRCAVCDAPGPNLCGGCDGVLEPRPHYFQRGPVTGLAATSYSPEVSNLLVAFKDKGQFALARELGLLMEPLARELAEVLGQCYLVPAPSRIQNFAKRGFQPSLLLARQLANRVPNAKVLNALVLSSDVLDQVGLSSAERISNLQGSMKLNQSVVGKTIFLVDDVVTTGATITEAWKTVSLGGAIVLGALVVSEARA